MSQKPVQLEIFGQDSKLRRKDSSYDNAAQLPIAFKFPTQFYIKIVAAIVLVIISFAVGVERGKIISKNDTEVRYLANNKLKTAESITNTGLANTVTKETNPIKVTALPLTKGIVKKENPAPVRNLPTQPATITTKKLEKSNKGDTLSTSNYVIQLATYKKNSSFVTKETSKLQQKGYKVITISSGDYTLLCAGNFVNKQNAQIQLDKLKKTYKGCFIRKI